MKIRGLEAPGPGNLLLGGVYFPFLEHLKNTALLGETACSCWNAPAGPP